MNSAAASRLDGPGSEQSLVLVDSADREIGTASKADCHRGAGILHRAFSVFLFDREGRLLLQQRSEHKPLWPHYWSNSCCSHPRPGEHPEDAASRRVREELNIGCELEYLYKFEYQATFEDVGSENELCWVYAGYFDGSPDAEPHEIAAMRRVTPDELSAEIAAAPDRFSPWIKLEWQRITAEFLPRILERASGAR